jgi:uncharacterized membrane protein YbhN (UPF0104 family)
MMGEAVGEVPVMSRRSLLGRLVVLAGLVAIVAAVMAAVPGLRDVLGQIGGMSPEWIAAALALELASCLSYVVVFRLFFTEVPARTAREVAWSEMASGVLLPGGGVGGLAVGGWLLRSAGMRTRAIVQNSSGVFLLTSAVNVLALGVAALLLLTGLATGPEAVALAAVPAAIAVVVLAGVWMLPRVARARDAESWRGDLLVGIDLTKAVLRRPQWRLVGAFGYLLFDIAVLWAAFAALGVHPPVAALVVGYLVGFLANLIPVPGGVGALDAGLVAALVLYGLPVETSAAAVLVYHAIAFWVPGAGGSLAYLRFRHRSARSARPLAVRRPEPAGVLA